MTERTKRTTPTLTHAAIRTIASYYSPDRTASVRATLTWHFEVASDVEEGLAMAATQRMLCRARHNIRNPESSIIWSPRWSPSDRVSITRHKAGRPALMRRACRRWCPSEALESLASPMRLGGSK